MRVLDGWDGLGGGSRTSERVRVKWRWVNGMRASLTRKGKFDCLSTLEDAEKLSSDKNLLLTGKQQRRSNSLTLFSCLMYLSHFHALFNAYSQHYHLCLSPIVSKSEVQLGLRLWYDKCWIDKVSLYKPLHLFRLLLSRLFCLLRALLYFPNNLLPLILDSMQSCFCLLFSGVERN